MTIVVATLFTTSASLRSTMVTTVASESIMGIRGHCIFIVSQSHDETSLMFACNDTLSNTLPIYRYIHSVFLSTIYRYRFWGSTSPTGLER